LVIIIPYFGSHYLSPFKCITEFPRVWVWVRMGYPQLTIYPRQPKYSGVQPTIYPTTDFLKHLILSYSFEIKQINERTNIYSKFYFSFICRLETRIFRLSGVYCRLDTRVFQFSRVYCQFKYPTRTHTHARGIIIIKITKLITNCYLVDLYRIALIF
jgi:hypothetical protein